LIRIFVALLLSPQLALAQFTQQGPKLVGTGAVGNAQQGSAVALSADGNTAIVGGPIDTGNNGAVWVYTRNGGIWSQQGTKLVDTGAVGGDEQGFSVALSADGNTAIVGSFLAAWIYTRDGGVWTQQGGKLVGNDAVGNAAQGSSVALSGDGNTAMVGGPADTSGIGAVWVYTRSNGVWTQQGSKLVGSGAAGNSAQGSSVALSGDGNTAMVGGLFDNSNAGAAWVYTRSNGVWTQQGNKLVGTGAAGPARQGQSVALSADGNTAIVGGPNDNSDTGAVWVYTRINSVWTQQGNKLTGSGAVGDPEQGQSVSLSADGNTAIVGGYGDNSGVPGAAWVFTRGNGVWTQQGSKLVGTGAAGQAQQGFSVALSADGNTAIVGGDLDNSNAGAAWVFVQPGLQVTPTTDMVATGNPGGPFAPSSFQYQLGATAGSMDYSISGLPNWLTASSTSGTVSAPTTVTFTVNANANSLAVGTYGPITITFTNTDTGQGTQTRTTTLTVNPPALQVPPQTLLAPPGRRAARSHLRRSATRSALRTAA
jgi:lipocalin